MYLENVNCYCLFYNFILACCVWYLCVLVYYFYKVVMINMYVLILPKCIYFDNNIFQNFTLFLLSHGTEYSTRLKKSY